MFFPKEFGRLDTLFDHKTCGRLWDIVGDLGQFVDIDIVTTKGHGFLMSFLGMTWSFFLLFKSSKGDSCDFWRFLLEAT